MTTEKDKPREAWQINTCTVCARSSVNPKLVATDEKRVVTHYCNGGHHWETRWEVPS